MGFITAACPYYGLHGLGNTALQRGGHMDSGGGVQQIPVQLLHGSLDLSTHFRLSAALHLRLGSLPLVLHLLFQPVNITPGAFVLFQQPVEFLLPYRAFLIMALCLTGKLFPQLSLIASVLLQQPQKFPLHGSRIITVGAFQLLYLLPVLLLHLLSFRLIQCLLCLVHRVPLGLVGCNGALCFLQ